MPPKKIATRRRLRKNISTIEPYIGKCHRCGERDIHCTFMWDEYKLACPFCRKLKFLEQYGIVTTNIQR